MTTEIVVRRCRKRAAPKEFERIVGLHLENWVE